MKLNVTPSTAEKPAWKDIQGRWDHVYGSFPQQGVSIEWHDFTTELPLDWALSFHDCSMEVCFNFSGSASWEGPASERKLAPKQVAVYSGGQSNWEVSRPEGVTHRFLTIEFSQAYLQGQLKESLNGISPEIQDFLENPSRHRPILDVRPMAPGLLGMRDQLLDPPVSQSAHSLWYPGKIMEIMASLFFRPDESAERFCDRTRRMNKQRVEQAAYLLRRDFANPPTLEMLAGEVNCSSFHLSRIFALEMGMTIPRYLRTLRIDKAAELLRGGGITVTAAAFAVGYSSLSAFNQAFVEMTGCCPGLYPARQEPFQSRGKGRPLTHER